MRRKKPIRHPVNRYKKKNGTVVQPHVKGSGKQIRTSKRTRRKIIESMSGRTMSERYANIGPNDVRRYLIRGYEIDLAEYGDGEYEYVNVRSLDNIRQTDTLTNVKAKASMLFNEYVIEDDESSTKVFITPALRKINTQENIQAKNTTKKMIALANEYNMLSRELKHVVVPIGKEVEFVIIKNEDYPAEYKPSRRAGLTGGYVRMEMLVGDDLSEISSDSYFTRGKAFRRKAFWTDMKRSFGKRPEDFTSKERGAIENSFKEAHKVKHSIRSKYQIAR